MLYIISEDSASGYQFWDTVNSICFKNRAEVRTSNGCSGIRDVLRSLYLTNRDAVVIAIDSTGTRQFDTVLSSIEVDSEKRGYKVIIPQYHCLEEVFLSFAYLIQWLNIDTKDIEMAKHIVLLQRFIRNENNLNYFSGDNELHDWCIKKFGNRPTRERMAKAILWSITQSYHKGFKITEKYISPCWFKDCSTNSYQRCAGNHCRIYSEFKQRATGIMKLTCVWDNSIIVKSLGRIQSTIANLQVYI